MLERKVARIYRWILTSNIQKYAKIVGAVLAISLLHAYGIQRTFSSAIAPLLDATFFGVIARELLVNISIATMVVYGFEVLIFTVGALVAQSRFFAGQDSLNLPKFAKFVPTPLLYLGIALFTANFYVGFEYLKPIFYSLIGLGIGLGLRYLTDQVLMRRARDAGEDVDEKRSKYLSGIQDDVSLLWTYLIAFLVLFYAYQSGQWKGKSIQGSDASVTVSYARGELVGVPVGRTSDFYLVSNDALGLLAIPISQIHWIK
jgi:hypothetical protein